MSAGQTKSDVFLGTTPNPGKPKGLLDALSEIQQYYVVEKSGSTIPEDFLTFKGKLAFLEVGFKGAIISGLITTLLTPVSLGVIYHYIPIFGSKEPDLFEKTFALILSVYFAIGYAFFIATVGKYYIGEISRAAIKSLMAGLIMGSVLKAGIAFIFFHFLFFDLLDPHRFAGFLIELIPVLGQQRLNAIYTWLMDFKPVFLTSAYFIVVTTILFIFIPLVSILINSRRTKKALKKEREWS